MNDLEKRISAIEKRNEAVEADKAWETSLLRRLVITFLTYALVVLYLVLIESDRPYLTAVVPAVGYFLSTLILGFIRNKYYK